MIAPDVVERVRSGTDLVALVAEHVPLRRAGTAWVARCPFHEERTPSFSVNGSRGVYFCLAGETRFLTSEGTRTLREMAGTSPTLLTTGGKWVEAPIRSFGVQPLMAVTLSRNGQRKVVHATPEHRWLLRRTPNRHAEVTTAELRKGASLAWSFPPSRVRNLGALSPFGIAHGICFGAGTLLNGLGVVDLHGEKAADLARWFPLCRSMPEFSATGAPYLKVLDLPASWKRLPSLDDSVNYLAGWLAGYLATDGHVSKDGTVMLNSSERAHLEFVRDVCTKLGIGTYGITTQWRVGLGQTEATALHRVHLITGDLDERFILRAGALERFRSARKSIERRGWVVRSVEPTDRVEEVFCATVEGTAAFTLEDNLLIGNCFGCKASGDAIGFLRAMEGLSFVEAVHRLGDRLGIEVEPEADPAVVAEQKRARSHRERLYAVCEAAACFFEDALAVDEPGALAAREALSERGVRDDTRALFRLGYAPAAWGALVAHLAAKGHSPADAELAGLCLGEGGSRGRFHDRFRHRLMFPVMERDGRVVAFSGRALGPAPAGSPPGVVLEDAGKYVNSPETPIYRKGEQLYGLVQARPALRTDPHATIVEGNFDVVQMHQCGFPRTVCPLGTAFTPAQAKLLRRFAEEVTLVLDGDEAGRKATAPAHAAAAAAGLWTSVAVLPARLDPDALLRRDGGQAEVAALVGGAMAAMAWLIDDAAARAGDLEGRRVEALRALAPRLIEVRDDIERGIFLARAADRLRIPRELAARAVADAFRARDRAAAAVPEGEGEPVRASAPRAVVPDADRQQRSPEEQARRAALVVPPGEAEGRVARQRALGAAVTALLALPEVLVTQDADDLVALAPEAWRPLVAAARDAWRTKESLDGPALLALAPDNDEARAWVAQRIVRPSEEPARPADDPQRESSPEVLAARHRAQFAQAVQSLRLGAARAREAAASREAASSLVRGENAAGTAALNEVLRERRLRMGLRST